MNTQLANYLLGLEKYVVDNGNFLENYQLYIQRPVQIKLKLGSKEDQDQEFLLDIKESEKKALKISLHHQDDVSKNGILRVDYHSRHKNPEMVLDTVPDEFKEFAGLYLDNYPGHIHYVVDGYKPLDWAIPLKYDRFPVKDITNDYDIKEAINAFCNSINLKTKIEINLQTKLLWNRG